MGAVGPSVTVGRCAVVRRCGGGGRGGGGGFAVSVNRIAEGCGRGGRFVHTGIVRRGTPESPSGISLSAAVGYVSGSARGTLGHMAAPAHAQRRAVRRGRLDAATASRPTRGRLLGGVCAGLAPVLGVPVGLVRFAFLLGVVAGGLGVVAYGAALILLPASEGSAPPAPRRDLIEHAAMTSIVMGGFLACRDLGAWPGDVVAIPGSVAAAGVAIVWGRAGAGRRSTRLGPWRIAAGTTLVALGAVGLLAANRDLAGIGQGAVGVGIVAVGLALVIGPAVGRLVGDLGTERRERIRSQERAEISAHLHDSVLQTLALIQRRSGDGREVQRLARRQERELRTWLLAGGPATDSTGGAETTATTIGGLIAEAAAEVEDDHGVRVEVVNVGDATLDDGLRALAQAGREAMANAARHAGVDQIDVFLEVEPGRPGRGGDVSLFVRDRGSGFDLGSVGSDRRGLSDSIIGRMTRAGGSADVRTAPNEGTEVELRVRTERMVA